MSEHFHEKGEVQKANRAVLRFKSDLKLSGQSYVDTLFATQRFVEIDFNIDETRSSAYLTQLEEERVLPSADMYSFDAEHALEMHRLAMYAQWMPLYRETHSSREFDDWLPEAINVMLPPDGKHTNAQCYSPIENPEEVSAMDVSCPSSTVCPLKFITNSLMFDTPYLPLDEYDQAMTNPKKVRTDANILLRRMCEKKIISQAQMNQAAIYYHKTYDELGM